MKISDVINSLQHALDLHGDLEAVYSTDDEGNNFHQVNWSGSLYFFESLEDYYLERVDDECFDEKTVKAICIN